MAKEREGDESEREGDETQEIQSLKQEIQSLKQEIQSLAPPIERPRQRLSVAERSPDAPVPKYRLRCEVIQPLLHMWDGSTTDKKTGQKKKQKTPLSIKCVEL